LTIQDELGGTFTSGTVTYDLNDDGVGLAPYHETDSLIPRRPRICDSVITGIKGGTINVDTRAPTRSWEMPVHKGHPEYTNSGLKSVTSAFDGWYSLTVSPGLEWNGHAIKTAYTFQPGSKFLCKRDGRCDWTKLHRQTSKTIYSTGHRMGMCAGAPPKFRDLAAVSIPH